jgi:hypothetical protein
VTQLSTFILAFIASIGSWLSSPSASFWIPPILGFGGAIAGAAMGARGQKKATLLTIESEYTKIRQQAFEQSFARLRARKEDMVVDRVVELLMATDPELSAKPDYPSILKAVHSIQLFLDYSDSSDKALNQAMQKLAFAARDLLCPSDDEAFIEHLASLQDRGLELEAMEAQTARDEEISRSLLSCQAGLIEATQRFLKASSLQKRINEVDS